MSHLTTIIGRVESKLKAYEGKEKDLRFDSIFLQAVRNLMDYMDCWEDSTVDEQKRATDLFHRFKNILIGTNYDYPQK